MDDGKSEEQIPAKEFAKLFGVPDRIMEKLEKNPVFEVNPKLTKPDKLNGGTTAPAGKRTRPIIRHKIKGITHTFRLASSVIPDKVNPRISTYEPKRVAFMEQLDIFPELEQALFMYVLPCCGDSPIAELSWHYRFQNKEKEALQITDKAGKIGKALTMINTSLSDQDIILIAKGIYAQNTGERAIIPNPSAKHKTLPEIKADLTTLALGDPDFFLANADNDVNQFYGMMFDGVDRGIFEIRNGSHGVRSWYWNYGPKKGEAIAEIKSGQKDFDVLRATIEANPNQYYDTLVKSIQQAAGKDNLAQFMSQKKAQGDRLSDQPPVKVATSAVRTQEKPPLHVPSIPEPEDAFTEDEDEIRELDAEENTFEVDNTDEEDVPVAFTLPATFNEACNLLGTYNGGRKAFGDKNGYFWRAIKEGRVNQENIAAIAAEALTWEKPL